MGPGSSPIGLPGSQPLRLRRNHRCCAVGFLKMARGPRLNRRLLYSSGYVKQQMAIAPDCRLPRLLGSLSKGGTFLGVCQRVATLELLHLHLRARIRCFHCRLGTSPYCASSWKCARSQ